MNDFRDYSDYLKHFGIKGMHWGIRRFQNLDGSLTAAGAKRYAVDALENIGNKVINIGNKVKNATTGVRSNAYDFLENVGNKVIDTYDFSKNSLEDYFDKESSRRAQKRFDEYRAKRNEYEKQVGYNEETDNWRKVNEDYNNASGKDTSLAMKLIQLNNVQNALDKNQKYSGAFDTIINGTRNGYNPGMNVFDKDFGSRLTDAYKNSDRREAYDLIRKQRSDLEYQRATFQKDFRTAAENLNKRTDFNKKLEDFAFSDFKIPESKLESIFDSIDKKLNSQEYKKYYEMVEDDLLMHSYLTHHGIKGQLGKTGVIDIAGRKYNGGGLTYENFGPEHAKSADWYRETYLNGGKKNG